MCEYGQRDEKRASKVFTFTFCPYFAFMAFNKHFNNELSVLIYADRERILDVLDNLLSNAMKYSYEGATIVINTSLAEDELIIEFKDEGLGLSEEDMKKLFTKFAKLSAIPTAHEKSYGLGLFIVKMLVESHKGKVWAESEGKNFGSSFFISLPTYKQG